MKVFYIILALFLASSPSLAEEAAKIAEPASSSAESAIAVEDTEGTLDLMPAQFGEGFIAIFTQVDKRTTCSGACGGVSVGSWTCPSTAPNCSLNCTTNPPTKGCH